MVRMKTGSWTTFIHAVLFVFGFSATFIVGWGGAFTLAGQIFSQYKLLLSQIGGLAVILFGLFHMGILRLPLLNYDMRPHWKGQQPAGVISSMLMGVFFAAGWTPCIGATLGAILTLGVSQETAGQAVMLSSGYALGLGLPFLVIGFGINRAVLLLSRFKRHSRKFQMVSGLLLILVGILILTNQLYVIAAWATRNGLYLDISSDRASVPTYVIAVLAGLLSFLSPCVLPLVPAYVGYLSGHAANGVQNGEVVL